jgi:hypothetical protein
MNKENSNSKKWIKEAEQKALNEAKYWNDFLVFLDSIQYKVSALVDDDYGNYEGSPKSKFNKAFHDLRHAAYSQQQVVLARCFALVGVGGQEAEDYSKERAKKVFSDDYSVMQWLETNHRLPSSWRTKDEEEFRQELKESLEGE